MSKKRCAPNLEWIDKEWGFRIKSGMRMRDLPEWFRPPGMPGVGYPELVYENGNLAYRKWILSTYIYDMFVDYILKEGDILIADTFGGGVKVEFCNYGAKKDFVFRFSMAHNKAMTLNKIYSRPRHNPKEQLMLAEKGMRGDASSSFMRGKARKVASEMIWC